MMLVLLSHLRKVVSECLRLAQGPTVRKWQCWRKFKSLVSRVWPFYLPWHCNWSLWNGRMRNEWVSQWGSEEDRMSQLSHSEEPKGGDKTWMQITRIQSKQWSHQRFGCNPLSIPSYLKCLLLPNSSPPRNQRAKHWGGGSLLWLAGLNHPLGGSLWRHEALQPRSLGGGGREEEE